MPLSNYALDQFVSQELSKLNACAPKAVDFKDAPLLPGVILRRIFQNHINPEAVPLAFAFIRRAEAALDEWNLACSSVNDLYPNENVSAYFKALRHFEACVAAMWQALDWFRRSPIFTALPATAQPLPGKLFMPGDGSVYERLNSLYNVSRHFDPFQDLPAGHTHACWLTNDGISWTANMGERSLSFDELLAELADVLVLARVFATGEASSKAVAP